MVSKSRSQVKGHLGQGHQIFRVGVKLINPMVCTESFVAIGRFLRELFAKKLRVVESPPWPARVPLEGRFCPPCLTPERMVVERRKKWQTKALNKKS